MMTPYEKLVAKKIANPLKMIETKITLSVSEVRRLAKGHYENGNVALYGTPQSQAAGALRSSISDMLKYIKFHLNENNEVIRLSHQMTWGDMKYHASGLNWQMNKTPGGHRRIWQSGGSFGFSSYCVVFPELSLGIVLLSNEADANSQSRLQMGYNPIPALEKVRCPVLAVFGELDTLTPVAETTSNYRKGLGKAGNKRFNDQGVSQVKLNEDLRS